MNELVEMGILTFLGLWLVLAAWLALAGNGRFERFRKFLWFNGWFSQWTMFLPDREGEIERFQISYRDKASNGEPGPWQQIELEKPWKPTLFLINPDIRLYGLMLKAVRSFAHMSDSGRRPHEAALFDFFQAVVLSYEKDELAEQRQVKVERFINEDEVVLLESDFLRLP